MKSSTIITVANNKGGVGKTTTVAALSSRIASKGHKVLMIDLDSQCSLTECFLDEIPEETIYDAFLSPREDWSRAVVEIAENLSLMPSSKLLDELDMMLAAKTQKESFLARVLKNMNVQSKYDFIVLDCSPSINLSTINALVATDYLFVPTVPEIMPLKGLKKLEQKIEEIVEDLNPELQIDGIIVTQHNMSKNLHNMAVRALREIYPDAVFTTKIRENIKLAEAPRVKKSIFEYAPESNGAKDYAALTDEIMEFMGIEEIPSTEP